MNTDSLANTQIIRVALVGCGRISANHIKAIVLHSDKAKLVALCDPDQDRLKSAQHLHDEAVKESALASYNLNQYTSYDNLLEDVKSNNLQVDLVVLTTPSGLHPAQTIAAAEVGLHVCTEKPMATRWEDGLAMVKACETSGVHLFVVKQNRFNTTLKLVKRQIQTGRFGQIFMVSVNVFWQRPQSYYDQAPWRGTLNLDGGALMNQASHYVDLLHWLIGPIDYLSASIATLNRNIESEDTAALQLRWANGALGTMSVTMLTYPRNLEGSITILGKNGSVKVGGTAVNVIEHWDFSDSSPDDKLIENSSYKTESVYGFGHAPYYENMLRVIQGLESPECNGREGLASLELLCAAYRSAKTRSYVNLPLIN